MVIEDRSVMQKFSFSILFALLSGFFLTGCQKEKDDLSMYVQEVKSRQKSDIPPIPVMKPYESFDYTASEYRDPFIPSITEDPESLPTPNYDNGISPDKNRRKEPLEQYDIKDLQFVGTINKDYEWGLIRTPEGIIHRVRIGNYIGKNDGLIMSLDESTISLREIIPDKQRGFIERDTSISVVEVN
jgi:type IV pilus assembly protein PilP